LLELARRDIHSYAQRRNALILPGILLHTGAAQYPVADGDDRAGLLYYRNKFGRRNGRIKAWPLPAQHRLYSSTAVNCPLTRLASSW
jgi:hypothetical protein